MKEAFFGFSMLEVALARNRICLDLWAWGLVRI